MMDLGDEVAVAAEDKKKAKRIEKARYRAKKKAIYPTQRIVAFDPFEVFERDGWRCMECGIDTPRSSAGMGRDDSPCLSHVVSVGAGGAHVPENCQCFCFKCKNPTRSAPVRHRLPETDFNPARSYYAVRDRGAMRGAAHGWDREAAVMWTASIEVAA